MRRGRREREDDGELVVQAVIHARLLGLRILSLDARVVVGRPPDPVMRFAPEVNGDIAAASGLSRAVELLTDGADTLERSRRLAHRSVPARRAG